MSIRLSACQRVVSPRPAMAQELTGTLKNIKDTGAITLGFRDSSIPFSYLDDNQKPIGYAMDICYKIVDAVKKELKLDKLEVKLNPVTSSTRIPLLGQRHHRSRMRLDHQQCRAPEADRLHQHPLPDCEPLRHEEGEQDQFDRRSQGQVGGFDRRHHQHQAADRGQCGRNLNVNIIPAKDHAEAFLMVETDRAVAFVMDDILLASLVAWLKGAG
jgi:glutamate/aspartate transport system substrate-binding protein